MMNFAADGLVKERIGTMKNILNRSALFLFVLAFTLLAPQGARAYRTLGPDRVLLMNNDDNPENPVYFQGYHDTDSTKPTYWVHSKETGYGRNSYLKPGITHTLYRNNSNGTVSALWHLEKSRAGNATFANDENSNYITWSKTSVSINGENRNPKDEDVGSVIFRNETGAAVYSPFYEEGIGAIYFDTVNVDVGHLTGRIAVEIATNAVNGLDFSEDTALEDCEWRALPLDVFEVYYRGRNQRVQVNEAKSGQYELVVDSDAGYDDLYFRVAVRVFDHLGQYRGPSRFRIYRLNNETTAKETTAWILVDDILASYPPMSIEMHNYGEYDKSLEKAEVQGFVGSYSQAFLSRASTNVMARAYFTYVTNGSEVVSDPYTQFTVTDAKFHYRWRYLNQTIGDWKEIPMVVRENTLESSSPLVINEGVGDLEFYYTVKQDAPHYEPLDYASGISRPLGEDWTEVPENVVFSGNYVDETPACGKDFFTRIREGVSDYEWVKLVTTVSTNASNIGTNGLLFGSEKSVRMELVGDHTWRYHYYVATNTVGETLRFHFQGKEYFKTNELDLAYSVRTNTWYSDLSAGLPYLPYTSVANSEYTLDVATPLDGAATHLMIDFNDELKSFSVSHASYQNFNMWTDALDGFRGNANYNDENPTNGASASGVSDLKKSFDADMGLWDTSSFTLNYWHEGFDYVELDDTTYRYDVHQVTATTPNGWDVENGAFVPGRRGVELDRDGAVQKSIAWQMDGYGKGSMTLRKSSVPGVGTVSFTARISQNPAFESFSTYLDGTRCTNYAVSAQLTMSRQYDAGNKLGPADIAPTHPSVSLVGYYRESKGCYELRFVRVDDSHLSAELWKWTQAAGEMTATLLTSNMLNTAGNSVPGPAPADFNSGKQRTLAKFDNLLIPTGGTFVNLNNEWTAAMFSLYTSGTRVFLDGWISDKRNTNRLDQDVANLKHAIHWVDEDPGALVRGSYGVGSCDCKASFGQIQKHNFSGSGDGIEDNRYNVNTKGEEQTDYFAEDWDIMDNRWCQMTTEESTQWKHAGLNAVIPDDQSVEILVADAVDGGSGAWKSLCTTNIATFSTNLFTLAVRTTDDSFVQLRTGMGDASVTVDDVDVTSWAAKDRGSTDSYYSGEWSYTRGVVETTADVEGGEMQVLPAGTNGYVFVFKDAGRTISFTPKADMVVDRLLLVGGGGAGGWTLGGGGGGGGVQDYDWGVTNAVTLKKGEVVRIVVGKGGDNYYVANNGSGNWKSGGNGGKSSVVNFGGKSYDAEGGGGGAGWGRTGNSLATGGGSAQGPNNGLSATRAPGRAGLGNSGGRAYGDRAGGGGGASLDADGEGEDGSAAKNGAGNGGNGRMSDITGRIEYYGGGGGGGAGTGGDRTPDSAMGGEGGLGGGGAGLNAAAKDRTVASTGGGELDGTNGLGGGGGGGSNGGANGTNAGGKGGSGVVMFRVRTAAKICTLQPSRAVIVGETEDDPGLVEPMGVRSPLLEDGMSLLSLTYANANSNCVLWLQVATNCPDHSMVGGFTDAFPELDNGMWETKAVWMFPGAAKGATATPNGVRTGVVTNLVPVSELASGTISFYQSLRAPVSGLMRVIIDPAVVREGKRRALSDPDYGRITVVGAYCYNEPELDMRSWWGWNLHTEGWNTHDKSYAYLADAPNGLSCMLNFSSKESDNNHKDANGIGLGEENVAEYAKNNPFVQCPPLTNGIGQVSFRARVFTNNQARSSWVTLFGSTEPDAYQPEDWDMWVKPNGTGGYKPLAEFEITNTTFQTFTWKSTDDNEPPHAIRIEVNAARWGRSPDPSQYNANWETPQAKPIQRVLIDEVSVSEPIVPRLVFRDVRPFRSRQLREEAHVAVSNVTSASEQPITGESWGIQATVEPQQMSDELDTDSMRVFASFHRGEIPWGYQNWAENERIVELPRMGSNLVFRSHMDRPESIQAPVEAFGTVQYMVFAEYKDRAGVVHTNWLKAAEWTPPSWYYGLEDLNARYGANIPERFSGYSIFDSVSPKRAWVNEVNYQNHDSDEVVDKRNQFIEFAVPQNADLSGWYLRITGSEMYSNRVLAVFGRGNATKTVKFGTVPGVDCTNSYTFMTLRSPLTTNTVVKQAADGVWDAVRDDRAHIGDNGTLNGYEPYGIALVRPSGVIEHEVVVEGRNAWQGTFLEPLFSGTNMTAEIKAKQPGSPWFFAGADQPKGTLGVWTSHGEAAVCWTNRMMQTPGQINRKEDGTLQDIDPEWFLRPNGTNVWIYANINSPHIAQVVAGVTNRSVQVIVIGKGESTNIVYALDRWYEIGTLTTNAEDSVAVEVAGARGRGGAHDTPPHQYTLRLDNVQSSMTVNAGDQASQVVVDAGLPRDDPYFPAVMHWLHNRFPEAEDGELHLADFLSLDDVKRGTLGIKDMYWLDIPPTESGWVLKGGMGSGDPNSGNPGCVPKGYVYTDWSSGEAKEVPATNVVVTLTLMISNTVTRAARAPTYLQGLEPGSSSIDYAGTGDHNWTSCTFKVTGALQKPGVEDKYLPLRWFVFGPDSFDENFQTKIEIMDPFLQQSTGGNYGWPAFRETYNIWYRWRLDGNGPGTASTELLKKDSTYP